jgi:hypothetical protein
MRPPTLHSAVIARLYDVVISSIAEKPSKERPDAIMERVKTARGLLFQNPKLARNNRSAQRFIEESWRGYGPRDPNFLRSNPIW